MSAQHRDNDRRPEEFLTVTPIEGELGLRYYVESESDPEHPYLVDLSYHNGNGACSCRSFQTSKWPAIRDGEELFTYYTTCKHLRAVHRYYLRTILPEHLRQFQQRAQE